MNRIDTAFARLKREGVAGLAPFICGGYPSLDSTHGALIALDRAGATLIEVGIPFSDPIADGPVIAAAMHHALSLGVTPRAVLDTITKARAQTQVPIVLMVSVSILWKLGVANFVNHAASAGVDGFILPDLPVDESDLFIPAIRDAGLTATLLLAPTTPPPRIERIAKACSGFVYLLARLGITGDSPSHQRSPEPALPLSGADIAARIKQIRQFTDLPIACGFGVSTPEHVAAVVRQGGADAAVVGSALVKRMARAASEISDPAAEAESFLRSLRAGLTSA